MNGKLTALQLTSVTVVDETIEPTEEEKAASDKYFANAEETRLYWQEKALVENMKARRLFADEDF